MEVSNELFWAVLILTIILLCKASDVFCYYTKMLVFVFVSFISATIFIPLMLARPRRYENALFPAWGARQISKILNLTWTLRGHKNIVNDTGCVVLINHQSCIDLLVLAELWPVLKRCTVISKREIFYLWPFGLACWLWGTVFIDRLNGPRAKDTLNTTSRTIQTNKAKICMFPEGTRHGGETLLPFKKGAFHIAIASQAPIQPVVVSQYTFLDSNAPKFNSGHGIISILPPIETTGFTKDDIDALMSKTYKIMSAEYNQLNEEIRRVKSFMN